MIHTWTDVGICEIVWICMNLYSPFDVVSIDDLHQSVATKLPDGHAQLCSEVVCVLVKNCLGAFHREQFVCGKFIY